MNTTISDQENNTNYSGLSQDKQAIINKIAEEWGTAETQIVTNILTSTIKKCGNNPKKLKKIFLYFTDIKIWVKLNQPLNQP